MTYLPFELGTMLAAFMISGASLAVTFFLSWLITKSEKFLINWVIAITLMTISVSIYRIDMEAYSPVLGAVAYVILVTGLSFLWGVSHEFRCGALPYRRVFILASSVSVTVALPMLAGYDGISYLLLNFMAFAILLSTAKGYWLIRSEAPLPIWTLSAFYAFVAVSFLPCAAMLLLEGNWRMGHIPSNWTEDLNMGVSLAGLVGIGALSLMLNQVRVARGHMIDAETDALTGLLNRRALSARVTATLDRSTAVLIVFDIDCFKQINDLHGHPKGDEVLYGFATILKECSRVDDVAVRLGGEEFALFLPSSTIAVAAIVGERIRTSFEQLIFTSSCGAFQSTVSAGISFAGGGVRDLDQLLHDADQALYEAKRAGRNRIAVQKAQRSEKT